MLSVPEKVNHVFVQHPYNIFAFDQMKIPRVLVRRLLRTAKSDPVHGERKKRLQKIERLRRREIPAPVALTCAGKQDGAGAQIHATISTIAFCRAIGLSYAHTPFSKVAHTSSAREISDWERFLSLSEFADTDLDPSLPKIGLYKYLADPGSAPKRFVAVVKHMHLYMDRYPHFYEPLHLRLRLNAQLGATQRPDKRPVVSLHVRRGDVNPEFEKRYTTNEFIVSQLKELPSRLPKLRNGAWDLHLYSQGDEGDFVEIVEHFPDVLLMLDTPPIETIRGLASADVMIMAKSSFSYVAALLCAGEVIYEPFWHAPQRNWISI